MIKRILGGIAAGIWTWRFVNKISEPDPFASTVAAFWLTGIVARHGTDEKLDEYYRLLHAGNQL